MNDMLNKCVIDFTGVKYYHDMHSIIRDSLSFPAYYGCNWDACWDCLHEKVNQPIYIMIKGLEIIQRKFGSEAEIFMDLLKKFKHYANDKYSDKIVIEILNENGIKTLLQ